MLSNALGESRIIFPADSSHCIMTFHPVNNLMYVFLLFRNNSTVNLNLGYNQLTGSIPTEVGLLTQLSEYAKIDCHECVFSVASGIGSYPLRDSNSSFLTAPQLIYRQVIMSWRERSQMRLVP